MVISAVPERAQFAAAAPAAAVAPVAVAPAPVAPALVAPALVAPAAYVAPAPAAPAIVADNAPVGLPEPQLAPAAPVGQPGAAAGAARRPPDVAKPSPRRPPSPSPCKRQLQRSRMRPQPSRPRRSPRSPREPPSASPEPLVRKPRSPRSRRPPSRRPRPSSRHGATVAAGDDSPCRSPGHPVRSGDSRCPASAGGDRATLIPRADLDRALGDFAALSQDVQVDQQATGGFRLAAVRPGCFFERIGLRPNDVVLRRRWPPHQRRRGRFGRLRLAALLTSQFSVEVLRGGRPLTLRRCDLAGDDRLRAVALATSSPSHTPCRRSRARIPHDGSVDSIIVHILVALHLASWAALPAAATFLLTACCLPAVGAVAALERLDDAIRRHLLHAAAPPFFVAPLSAFFSTVPRSSATPPAPLLPSPKIPTLPRQRPFRPCRSART